MQLRELLRAIPEIPLGGLPDLAISRLTADSRQVEPGALFVAVRGTAADGHHFLPQAVERGAVAAIGEVPDPALGIPYFQVRDSRLALARLASAWYGNPSQRLTVIGITGTDGKTTTANLLFRILQRAGLKAGLITTVNAIIGDEVLDTGLHVTTPDALQVQGYLAQMVEAGLTHCVLEATSHGLAQRRVAAVDFDVAVVTNITHEHLDYHGSPRAYRQAKALLFRALDEGTAKPGGVPKTAVLNLDDSSYGFLQARTHARQVTYGLREDAQVRALILGDTPRGLRLLVAGRGYRVAVQSRLVGRYNASNILAAFAAAVEGLGIAPEAAARGVAVLQGVPGRMEPVALGQPFMTVVDFAHTPNALRQALETVRGWTQGRVIAVFGSAGLRDRAKRRMMAEVSAELADFTVLTAEDPRTESLQEILAEMAQGAVAKGAVEGRDFWRVPDRGQALRFAVGLAEPGDVVIACGKGHEQSMCFGETEYPWDDRKAMRAALAELLGIEGPQMPWLPTSEEKGAS